MHTTVDSVALSATNVDGAVKPNSSNEPIILTKEIKFVPGRDMQEVNFVVDTAIPNDSTQD